MTYDEFKSEWNSTGKDIVCMTSGSTGIPSTISLPKVQMINSARRTSLYFNISSKSRLHSCISPDYIGGKMMFVRSIVSGASFSYECPSNTPLENIDRKITLVSVVPSQMINILDSPQKLEKIEHFLIGGAAIPPAVKKKIIDKRVSAYESYGMTETSSHIALRRISVNDDFFKTLPGISVFYHDGNKLGIDINGWKRFLTNDIAFIDSPSSFKILGRADNIINTGGKKVSPEEIESVLQTKLDFPFFISSKKDDKWGQKIVFATTNKDVTLNNINDICRQLLPAFKCPKEIVYMDEIPTTPNGKLKRISF